MPIGINRIKSMKGDFGALRSVYNIEGYAEVFKELWQGKYRYVVLNKQGVSR
ncbi:hypothetical protein P0082_04330 [Candidatus Haliotispira prima]|uniref:Uncharacterized protein n=1 Tax=Candidatus Haliotispira prima TaxID=3034016 RepID=A0ABY8MJ98_9SPIO|nr:hypothetical protein P0082_04330 [Candidatus Haliotispira prima]